VLSPLALHLVFIFACGLGGSLAVEIVTLHQYYERGDITLPERYKSIGFWIIRFLLAIIGGCLALAYEIDKPLLAANIGAATPLIIKAFAEGIKPALANMPPLAKKEKKTLTS
jgi:hypothetical protein